MQTRENDVLVVARIAQDRRSAGRARQILEQSAVLDDELDSGERLATASAAEQFGTADRPSAVHRIEIERRRARIRRVLRSDGSPRRRAQIERDVVIDELTEEGRAGRVLVLSGLLTLSAGSVISRSDRAPADPSRP